MGIKTFPHPPHSLDLAPSDFWLFPKHTGCRYETIEEMKEAVTKVIDSLTQEDFHGAFLKLLNRYNKCIAAGGDFFEGDKGFMCVLSINVPIRKKYGNLFNDPQDFFRMGTFIDSTHVKASSRVCRWICSVWPFWVWESQHASIGNSVTWSLGHCSKSSFHRRSSEHQELRDLN